ncbi:MAG: dethiobiotin synthase [Planctomycetota bacterium]|jgi:dethiobiotin synthetase
MARGWFVTATDTGVGKTVIAGALAILVGQQNKRPGVFKPVSTGCRLDLHLGLVNEDTEFLAHCANAQQTLDIINPVRYSGDLAPMVAAERAQKPIEWDKIDESWTTISQSSDWVIVEGAGGLLVPIDKDRKIADLAVMFDLPLIIVTRPGLGTINHTLLTVEAAKARKLSIAAVVINHYRPASATLAEETNPEVIGRLTNHSIPIPISIRAPLAKPCFTL